MVVVARSELFLQISKILGVSNPINKKHFDKQGESLLLAAKTSWASTPNRQGAEYALEYIRQIDPSSKAFPAAQELIKEIKR